MDRMKPKNVLSRSLYYKIATRLLGFNRKKQAEEELGSELWRSGHGSGETIFEKPETLEHTHEVVEEGSKAMDNEIFNKQIDVKGES